VDTELTPFAIHKVKPSNHPHDRWFVWQIPARAIVCGLYRSHAVVGQPDCTEGQQKILSTPRHFAKFFLQKSKLQIY
jgi:hypothetical protein